MSRIMLYFLLVYEQNRPVQHYAQLTVVKHFTPNLIQCPIHVIPIFFNILKS